MENEEFKYQDMSKVSSLFGISTLSGFNPEEQIDRFFDQILLHLCEDVDWDIVERC